MDMEMELGTRSYPALRVLAVLLKIATGIGALGGLIAGIDAASGAGSGGAGFFTFLAFLLLTALICVVIWASAELLLLFANMGEDIGKMSATLDAHDVSRFKRDTAEIIKLLSKGGAALGERQAGG